jgi:hypothetical protein
MDRDDLSAAIIQEMGAVFMTALAEALPAVWTSDLAGMEQRLRQVGRVVFGSVVERVAAVQGSELERGTCPACGGSLRRVDQARRRSVQGLVGDYTLYRAYYRCSVCAQGHAPLDARLGLGTGSLSPGLLRVACREGIEGGFADAADRVVESVGVRIDDEVLRRLSEGIGAVAEAQTQAAMARVARGQAAWTPADPVDTPESGVLAVEVDGMFVHRDDDWHEMKVVTVAPLGPGVEVDADTGRERLWWGRASYGAGFEEAPSFWGRAHVEACRRGLGTPAVRTVVALGDGAEWIWRHARAFLALPGVEVVEIIDLYHAYEYLWGVGNIVFGEGTAAAAAWVEPLKTRLYQEGAAPLRAALRALARTVGVPDPDGAADADGDAEGESAAATAVRRALAYVTTNAARLDYPAFIARRFPIGSGAVESSCKSVVQARAKGAGMRWSAAGAQQVVSLRALHRSGRWDAFWHAQPQRARLLLFPRAPRTRVARPPAEAPAAPGTPPAAPGTPPAAPGTPPAAPGTPPAAVPPPTPAVVSPVPRLLRPAADHPWRRQSLGRARSA